MSRERFSFKQFIIDQDRCAMKVGTDGVLLGAWATLEGNPDSILDIGAGTGLIALMMAQRSDAGTIDAVEVDASAYEQCVENFETSPWSNRLFCYHAGLDEFAAEWEDRYDLIICNPPFYYEDVSSGNTSRNTARQMAALPFEELLSGVSQLLSQQGSLATIIPFKEEDRFLTQAAVFDLYPKRITRVRGNPNTKLKRSLLQLGTRQTDSDKPEPDIYGPKINELVVEYERHAYTQEYQKLTKDFYLKM